MALASRRGSPTLAGTIIPPRRRQPMPPRCSPDAYVRKADCGACPARALCTRKPHQPRHPRLPPRAEHEALKAARGQLTTEAGRRRYARRAGIEGTISQGVRAFGLRRSRYRGLARTHLQHVATAAAVNLARLDAWFDAIPRAATRTSRFAALATA